MDFGQFIRQLGRSLRAWLAELIAWLRKSLHDVAARVSDSATHGGGPLAFFMRLGGVWRAVAFFILALLIIYPLGAWWASVIDDDPNFGAAERALKPAQSLAVANAAALLDREVNVHGWTPNDTWLWPTALLDNMPNYQRGIATALAHFTVTLNGQIAHAAGATPDADLQEAADDLQYSPDAWSVWPLATAEHEYGAGIDALNRYNERLATGAATFDRRSDNLRTLLARIGTDLDAASASIDNHLRTRTGFFINNKADDVFYTAKGEMYADYIVLKGLQRDFAAVIKTHNLGSNWQSMMDGLRGGIGLRPWVVLNGEPDSQFVPCPLCAEGFYLLRARTEMQGIADGLAK